MTGITCSGGWADVAGDRTGRDREAESEAGMDNRRQDDHKTGPRSVAKSSGIIRLCLSIRLSGQVTIMNKHLVIPARLASTRLPAKPLALLHGEPLILRVAAQARGIVQTLALDSLIIATDSEQIADICRPHGLQVVMTAAHHPSGTDRLAEVAQQLDWAPEDMVINLQGDEPLLPAAAVAQVIQLLRDLPHCQMATLCEPITQANWFTQPSIVKVVRTPAGEALYFSRSAIPHDRQQRASDAMPAAARRHLGLYAYRVALLRAYVGWQPTPLEQLEGLEQLRILEHGGRIAIADAVVSLPPGVDTPDDLARLNAMPASCFASL